MHRRSPTRMPIFRATVTPIHATPEPNPSDGSTCSLPDSFIPQAPQSLNRTELAGDAVSFLQERFRLAGGFFSEVPLHIVFDRQESLSHDQVGGHSLIDFRSIPKLYKPAISGPMKRIFPVSSGSRTNKPGDLPPPRKTTLSA
jgi:hypothetical protein